MTGGKFKLPKRHRKFLSALENHLKGTGISFQYDLTGRHPKLHFTNGSSTHTMIFASTPREDRPEDYARWKAAKVKRLLIPDAAAIASGQYRQGEEK